MARSDCLVVSPDVGAGRTGVFQLEVLPPYSSEDRVSADFIYRSPISLTSKKWRHSYPPVDVRETCAHLPTSGRPETASGVLQGSYFFHTCLKLVDPENGLLRILWFWLCFTRLCFLPRIRIWELLKVTQLLEWCSNSWSSIGLIKTFKNERVFGLQEIGFPRRANSNPGFTRGRQLVSLRFKIASLCHRVGWLAVWSVVCWWMWWIWLCWLGPFVRLCFALDLFFFGVLDKMCAISSRLIMMTSSNGNIFRVIGPL